MLRSMGRKAKKGIRSTKAIQHAKDTQGESVSRAIMRPLEEIQEARKQEANERLLTAIVGNGKADRFIYSRELVREELAARIARQFVKVETALGYDEFVPVPGALAEAFATAMLEALPVFRSLLPNEQVSATLRKVESAREAIAGKIPEAEAGRRSVTDREGTRKARKEDSAIDALVSALEARRAIPAVSRAAIGGVAVTVAERVSHFLRMTGSTINREGEFETIGKRVESLEALAETHTANAEAEGDSLNWAEAVDTIIANTNAATHIPAYASQSDFANWRDCLAMLSRTERNAAFSVLYSGESRATANALQRARERGKRYAIAVQEARSADPDTKREKEQEARKRRARLTNQRAAEFTANDSRLIYAFLFNGAFTPSATGSEQPSARATFRPNANASRLRSGNHAIPYETASARALRLALEAVGNAARTNGEPSTAHGKAHGNARYETPEAVVSGVWAERTKREAGIGVSRLREPIGKVTPIEITGAGVTEREFSFTVRNAVRELARTRYADCVRAAKEGGFPSAMRAIAAFVSEREFYAMQYAMRPDSDPVNPPFPMIAERIPEGDTDNITESLVSGITATAFPALAEAAEARRTETNERAHDNAIRALVPILLPDSPEQEAERQDATPETAREKANRKRRIRRAARRRAEADNRKAERAALIHAQRRIGQRRLTLLLLAVARTATGRREGVSACFLLDGKAEAAHAVASAANARTNGRKVKLGKRAAKRAANATATATVTKAAKASTKAAKRRTAKQEKQEKQTRRAANA